MHANTGWPSAGTFVELYGGHSLTACFPWIRPCATESILTQAECGATDYVLTRYTLIGPQVIHTHSVGIFQGVKQCPI